MATSKLYLHLGDLPANGKSLCWTLTRGTWDEGAWGELSEERQAEFLAAGYTVDGSEVSEPGLSVFGLDADSFEDEAEIVFLVNDSDPDNVVDWCDRPAVLIRGRELCRGFDGEPVIQVTEVVGTASGAVYDRKRGRITVQR